MLCGSSVSTTDNILKNYFRDGFLSKPAARVVFGTIFADLGPEENLAREGVSLIDMNAWPLDLPDPRVHQCIYRHSSPTAPELVEAFLPRSLVSA